ncbi:hypothetical protein FRC01_004717 [Tulasnella sp. 417]|nr:hypothetical protein FRC01_004717 [Tulasnella sp. 417]
MSVQTGAQDVAAESTGSWALGPAAQVLFTPELLSLVFSHIHSASLATSARVCKAWSDTALNELWRDLDSVFPLLELLFDINLIKGEHDSRLLKELTNILGDADWNRFHSYGERVRSLDFDQAWTYREDPDIPDFDSNVAATLCLHHPFGAAFLPHLRNLRWTTDGSALPMLPFLSSELKKLYIDMSTETASTANEVFKAIVHRTPSLINFELQAQVQSPSIITSLARWFETTPNLEEVSLPPNYLTSPLIRALGSLPKLKKIEASLRFFGSIDPPSELQHLPCGNFPHLRYLGFHATLSGARKFLLASREVVSQLTHISLHAGGVLDSENILNFARHVAQNCPMVTELGLDLFTDQGEQSLSPLTVVLLESLYPCSQLQSLEIGHPFPLTFQEDDVEQMGRAWPRMVLLDLCNDPNTSLPLGVQMGNSLSILPIFASALPELEVLGLYFNNQEALPFAGNLYPQYQFQKLSQLRFGLSPIPEGRSHQVAFYIASLCKKSPIITFRSSDWYVGTLPSDWEETQRAWEKIRDLVDFAMEVKLAGLSSLRD